MSSAVGDFRPYWAAVGPITYWAQFSAGLFCFAKACVGNMGNNRARASTSLNLQITPAPTEMNGWDLEPGVAHAELCQSNPLCTEGT